jgi:hypothetical protein
LVEESFLESQAFLGEETPVDVFVVGQIFFIACHHVKHGGKGVEREVEVAPVNGEENPLSINAFCTGLLLLDGGLEEQCVTLDEEALPEPFLAVIEFGITVL